jgi:hypothetical protein
MFTFLEPANDIPVEESEDVVEEEEYDAIARPQTCFERLCDQILDATRHPCKQKKQTRGFGPAIPSNHQINLFGCFLDLT